MRILAIDPATKTGWAVSKLLSGSEDFKPRNGESSGYKLIKFKNFFNKLIETEKIELVVFERAGGRFKNDIMSHAKFIAIIEIICIEKGIDYKPYSSGEIKMHATGKGNAKKPDMIKAAIRLFKKPIQDDNEADALCLLSLAQKDHS